MCHRDSPAICDNMESILRRKESERNVGWSHRNETILSFIVILICFCMFRQNEHILESLKLSTRADSLAFYSTLVSLSQMAFTMEKKSNESSITSSPTHSQTQVSKLHSSFRYCVIARCLFLAGICFSSLGFVDARQTGNNHGSSYAATRKVPFEVHIESRCPDARDCLQKLVTPAYWQVEDKVDFRISYVGK